MQSKRFTKIRETKYTKNRDATARLRENAIYNRYFLKGEQLESIRLDLGYKSISAIEKAVARVKQKYNLPTKREMTGEALDNPIIAYNPNVEEVFLFFTNVQIEKAGFKKQNALHSLVYSTYTRKLKRKNAIKWYFVLAKDYKCTGLEPIEIRRNVAKIKMNWIMKWK